MSDDPNVPDRNPGFAEQMRPQQHQKSPGEMRRLPGCFPLAVGSVTALFISVVGLCGVGGPPGNARIGIFFIFVALAEILFVAAIIIGVYKLFSGHH